MSYNRKNSVRFMPIEKHSGFRVVVVHGNGYRENYVVRYAYLQKFISSYVERSGIYVSVLARGFYNFPLGQLYFPSIDGYDSFEVSCFDLPF